jgi:hypothetical protein
MATEKMNTDEGYKYLRMLQERYRSADRGSKTRLLDEAHLVTGKHRKYLIACLNNPDLRRHKRNRERSRTYGADVEQVVAMVADTLDWIGPERLQPGLATTAQHLARFGHLTLSEELLTKLQAVSVGTVGRIMRRIGRPRDAPPQVRRGRRPDSVVQALVPVGVIPWDEPEPGHFEADLVLHNLANVEGAYVSSLQCIDVLTGWSERFAVMGHGFSEMWQAVQAFKTRCPIRVREIHTDNGSEFMNQVFASQFDTQALDAHLTRGRLGCKNDNRFVEQKNSSLIRAYLGNLYLYTPTHRALLDKLYADMGLYYNLFQPVVRQTSRHAEVGANGVVRIVRAQDRAATPLERLLRAKPPLASATREQLVALHHDTDPLELKRRIHRQLTELTRLAQLDAQRDAVLFR